MRRLRIQLRRHAALLAPTLAIALVLPAIGSDAVRPPCSEKMSGGEWASYGQNAMGQQRQDAESSIGPSTVSGLNEVWSVAGTGYQSPPPIVAGGCVFINTNGHIDALDLRTGARVWRSTSDIDTSGTFAVTVVDGRVHLGLATGGRPRAAALDQHSGKLLWLSNEIWFGYTAEQQSSAIVFNGIQVLFTTGPDFDPAAQQGYGLIDAATGKVLYKALTLPKADRDKGYVGGGVWGTPTVDPKTRYLYVGTSNPESKQGESAYDDAIIKIDLDRSRKTFGRIVGSYKGTRDSYTGYDNPVCQSIGGTVWVNTPNYGSSPLCGQLDVDFGVGPTLWRNTAGRLMGAATQKSGWIHAFYGDTMKPAWSRQLFVTLSFLGGNIARIATDSKVLYVVANPGVLYALNPDDGSTIWSQPLVGVPMKGGNVALANGVVYYTNEQGALAYDARTGARLWSSPFHPGASIGSGIAIAGHYVVVNHYGTIAAYRLNA